MKKYVSLNNLLLFLDNLKNNFSDINHTHVISNVENLQATFNDVQSDIDTLEQSIADLTKNMKYNIVPITQGEYDALTTVDENTLYIIEV